MDHFVNLGYKIKEKSATVSIVGLGYVGLPLAFNVVKNGFRAVGYDVDSSKITSLEKGEIYISNVECDGLKGFIENKQFIPTGQTHMLKESDIIIITVPTPLTKNREPDLRYVVETCEVIAKNLRSGTLICLESTTYPGTTRDLMKGILEKSGLLCGSDFFIAYSPEREDPGNKTHTVNTIPKVVGGLGERATQLAVNFYSKIVPNVVKVSSCEVAEATKLTENIFRAVNIALVNELKVVYDKMGIDIWEVIDAAASKPFGFMKFSPGPGWGGHCIPLDPFYLTWKAREYGVSSKFIELAGEVNVSMPDWVVKKIQDALNLQKKSISNSNVLLVGISYKKDIEDTRESPALVIMKKLEEGGAVVSYYDPYNPFVPLMRDAPEKEGMSSCELTESEISKNDVCVILTDHSNIDYKKILKYASLIVDTRGVYKKFDKIYEGQLQNVISA